MKHKTNSMAEDRVLLPTLPRREKGMKKKVLMLASVASMIDQFNMPNIELLLELGCEVHVACNFQRGNTCNDKRIAALKRTLQDWHVPYYQWNCPRDLKKPAAVFQAYRQLLALTGRIPFAWMHCHSPIGAALARMAAHRRGIHVIYTAHGFHFYQGAPLKNRLLYYPVEKVLAGQTDVLLTVNREDFAFAKRNFAAGKIYRIPGAGIDTKKFQTAGKIGEHDAFCRRFGIPKDTIILLSVGELNKGKNHQLVIQALARLKQDNVCYIICGQGTLKKELLELADFLGVTRQIRLPGFCEDIAVMYRNAHIFVFPSVREGLPVALMEAMAAGLPCVASDIRGNRELLSEKGGMLFPSGHVQQLQKELETLLLNKELRRSFGRHNQYEAKKYDMIQVQKGMRRIYGQIIQNRFTK